MDRKVYLASRLRPMTPRELSLGSKSCVVVDGGCTTIVNPETGDAKAFVLDYSFDSSEPSDRTGNYADNLVLFQELGTLMIQSTLAGFNTCLFCHGAPQSGKTYTLIGQESDPGMLPRVLESLFQQDPVINGDAVVFASFYEVVDEQVRDILKRDFYAPGGLKVRNMGEGNGCHIEGLSRCKLQNMADCEDLLAQVLHALSAIASTSHTIFTISLYSANYVENPDPNLAPKQTLTPLSKLHLVDLASGGAGASDMGGASIPGAKPKTNAQDKSLLAWANVMSALAENQMNQLQGKRGVGKVHVPFRGSILTRVLEDSLGANSRSIIVANLSPAHHSYRDTLNTFRHIVRTKEVKKVARNPAILNAYLGVDDYIPAAGGGWRWSYCTKLPDDVGGDGGL